MQLVQVIQTNSTDLLEKIAFLSKNLFNVATYTVRQEFFKSGKWLRYNDLYRLLRTHRDYKLLHETCGSQTPQQVLKQVDRNFKSFFNALKSWKKDPSKFKSRPNLPKYKRKDGRNFVYFTSQHCRLKNGRLHLTKKMHSRGFPCFKTSLAEIKGVRIVPYGDRFKVELIYNREAQVLNLDSNRALGIDLGLTNVITTANNCGLRPFIIKGGVLKSINQYYNKALADAKSSAKICNNAHMTLKIRRLTRVRNNKIHDFFHQTSRTVTKYCIRNNMGTIVIGYNEGWKQNINIGKRNNQNFVSIPFRKLIHQMQYKADLAGIELKLVSEEYTSQTCSSCGIIRKANRKYRGLYVCNSCGTVLNADTNAATNILQKEVPKSMRIGNSGCGYRPAVLVL